MEGPIDPRMLVVLQKLDEIEREAAARLAKYARRGESSVEEVLFQASAQREAEAAKELSELKGVSFEKALATVRGQRPPPKSNAMRDARTRQRMALALVYVQAARAAVEAGDLFSGMEKMAGAVSSFLGDFAETAIGRAARAREGKRQETKEKHDDWMKRDLDLAARRPDLNQTGRANAIAGRTGANAKTVRRVLTNMHSKKLSAGV